MAAQLAHLSESWWEAASDRYRPLRVSELVVVPQQARMRAAPSLALGSAVLV